MNENILIRRRQGTHEFQRALVFVGVFLVLVWLLYNYEPFSEFWNNLLSNILTIFAAGFSAFFALLVFRRYELSDAPYTIWAYFAIGLWLWTLAEFVWAVYNMVYGEVGITFADIFWVCAYAFFGYAVYSQYRVIFHPSKRGSVYWIFSRLALTAALTILFAWLLVRFLEEPPGLPLWVESFYPAADFVIGFAALRIVYRFRGGALGYPWLGLFVFAIADMLYAILDLGGFYTWSINEGNLWSMVADLTYTTAYLLVGLGCFAQLLLLKYGPVFNTRKDMKK